MFRLTVVERRPLSTPRLAAGFSLELPFRRNPIRNAAEQAYILIVEQSRRPAFYAELRVPDTLDGRFEVICLHAFLYMHRLKGEAEPAGALSQRLFDTMFGDFDRSLREIGVGDLSVGRQISRMAEAFYGRVRAYEDGLAGDDEMLQAALARNLYGTAAAAPEALARAAAYLRREAESLAAQPLAALTAGTIAFGAP